MYGKSGDMPKTERSTPHQPMAHRFAGRFQIIALDMALLISRRACFIILGLFLVSPRAAWGQPDLMHFMPHTPLVRGFFGLWDGGPVHPWLGVR